MARLKTENKTLLVETKELEMSKDALQLQLERRTVSVARTRVPSEAWGEQKKEDKRESADSCDAEHGEARDKLDHLIDLLEEKRTKIDYNRDRSAAMDKKLKALPDFESSSGLWADDDTMEVPEAYAPSETVKVSALLSLLWKITRELTC